MILIIRKMFCLRIFMVLLCLMFLGVPVKMAPKMCHAFGKERAHTDDFHFAPGISCSNSSLPHIPFGNRCACPSSVTSCCMGPIHSEPRTAQVSLISRDNTYKPSVAGAARIHPSLYMTLRQNERCSNEYIICQRTEFFLSNCTLLI